MGPTLIARNYAETLLTLAQRHGGPPTEDAFGEALEEVVAMLRQDPRIRNFLETPRVDLEEKQRVLRAAFGGRVPDLFLRFLLLVFDKRRQRLIPQIMQEYHDLIDQARGRVRAQVTVAQEPDLELRQEIVTSLQRKMGKEVLARFEVDPSLIGGVVVRVEDQVLDGSLRTRLANLRRRLLVTSLPEGVLG